MSHGDWVKSPRCPGRPSAFVEPLNYWGGNDAAWRLPWRAPSAPLAPVRQTLASRCEMACRVQATSATRLRQEFQFPSKVGGKQQRRRG